MVFVKNIKEWVHDESGATAIEYSLIAGAMALAMVPALSAFSADVGGVYGKILGYFDLL